MENKKLLHNFRNVLKSHSSYLSVVKDNIKFLLGKPQNAWSGIYRESLVKEVLRKILPEGVSIDNGFIYGYGDVSENSKQLDIIIWNSNKHSPIYRTKEFVILSAESVISIISVKSKSNNKEIEHSMENVSSVIPLDLSFRNNFSKYFKDSEECRPITKYLLFLNEKKISEENKNEYGLNISNYYVNMINSNEKYKTFLMDLIKETNFISDSNETIENKINRVRFSIIYPRQIFSATADSFSYYFGFGENPKKKKGFEWIPILYFQNSKRTSSFEKFIYYLMQDIYKSLGTIGIPFLSAVGNMDPRLGSDNEDISEIDETIKFPLIELK